jgi:uncharacterized membrane protein
MASSAQPERTRRTRGNAIINAAHGGTAEYSQSRRTRPGAGGPEARAQSVAIGLGWFSIGLGLAEVVAPGRIARLVGAEDDAETRTLVRILGARELMSGLGILSGRRQAEWLWSRVAGDAMDLALLGRVSATEGSRAKAVGAAAAVVGVTALDVLAAQRLSGARPESSEPSGDGIVYTKRSITVRRDPGEVYAFWRDFERLPTFMRHLESVRVTGERTSHWVAKGPAGKMVEWDAEIILDRPNELIAWRSVEGSDVFNAGTVRFTPAPGERGTEVRVDLAYDPPGGKIASKVAMLFRKEPGQQVQDDLRHFKQVLELGEVVASDASVHRGMHPAQPSEGTQ